MQIPTLTPHQLAAALTSTNPPQLLDVREPAEVAQSSLRHLTAKISAQPNPDPCSLIPDHFVHSPLGQLPEKLANHTTTLNPAHPVAVICKSGGRSARATQLLINHGFTAHNLTGGMLAYRSEVDPTLPPIL